jgi:alpha-N-arabinofuranosidase
MDFDAEVKIQKNDNKVFLEIVMDKNWLSQKRELVTTGILPNAVIPNLPYVNPDGSPIIINTDYFGIKRNIGNLSPGPFEITNSGKQSLQVWPRQQ